jgi:environmental stress-induced protein Ves
MRLIRQSEYAVMPWKNGGGTTREIARFPAQGAFAWRVSIADVNETGPFSRFDGHDRHILMLEGEGMRLDAGKNGVIQLDEPLLPTSFPGEWDINGILVGGPVRDFNLMTARGAFTGELRAERITQPLKLGNATHVVHVATGRLAEAATGDSLLIEGGALLHPQGPTNLVIATLTPR